ncbi:uncharacterized protein [Anabrus simplex]|uniref:uncharacterized protein n=1 Tax=Anabrus simplex TaxID=316456 RepID=UPI0035A2B9B3
MDENGKDNSPGPSNSNTKGELAESAEVHRQEHTSPLRTDAKHKTACWLLDHHGSTGVSAETAELQYKESTSPVRIDTNCETTRWLHEGSISSSNPCLSQKGTYQLATHFEPRTRKKPSAQVKSRRRHETLARNSLPRSQSWHRPLGSTKLLFKKDEQFQMPSWLTTLDFITLCKIKCILQKNNMEYDENDDDKAIRILNLLKGAEYALRLSPKKCKRCDLCMRRETCNCKKKSRIDRAERQTIENPRGLDSLTAARRWQRRKMRRKYQITH